MAEDISMDGMASQPAKCGQSPADPAEQFSQVSSQGDVESVSTTIDSLPDGVLSIVLSKLRDAHLIAQAATVCKRWRSCSAGVDTLRLDFKGFQDDDDVDDDEENSSGEDSVSSCSGCEHDVQNMREVYDRMVTKCTGLRKLTIRNFRCVSKAMKETFARSIQNSSHSLEQLELHGEFELDWTVMKELSRCSKLQSLHLECCTGSRFSSFKVHDETTSQFSSLTKCVLRHLDMSRSTVELLVKLAPLLEELDVTSSSQSLVLGASNLRWFRILGSDGVKDLTLELDGVKDVTLDAPKLEYLFMDSVTEFRTEGDALLEINLRSPTKLVFKTTPRLKALELSGCGWSTARICECLDMAKSAIEIQLLVADNLGPLTFSQLFEDFPELKRLTLGMSIVESFLEGNLENKINSPPPLESVSLESPYANSKAIALASLILELSSCLSSFDITLANRPSGSFCTQLMKLQARYNKVAFEIVVLDDDCYNDVPSDYEDEYDEDDDEEEEEDDDHDDEDSESDEESESDEDDFNGFFFMGPL